jgi:hypothetical protein
MSPTARLPNEEQTKTVTEVQFVTRVEKLMRSILPRRLVVRRGASLLYEVRAVERLVKREVRTSRQLESIAFGKTGAAVYRSRNSPTATGTDRRRQ